MASSPTPGGRDALHHFRSTRQPRHRLHPLERALLWVIGAHLSFLPWALGGVERWSQLTSLALALVGFALALVPRNYSDEFTSGPAFRLLPFPRLLRFPLFWAGLFLLGCIATQALNPAWIYKTDSKVWWVEPLPHLRWLPHGTDNPFAIGGPWRMLILYASAWLVVCSLWVGITRRRSLQILVIAFVANGFALAVFALVQRLAGNGKIFWAIKSSNSSFFGSFIYKNHAGGYLLLVLVACCALAAWFYFRGVRRMEKSNPSVLFVFFSVLVAVSIFVSFARGATLFSLLFLVLAVGAFLVFQVRQPPELRRPLLGVMLLLVLGGFVFTGYQTLSGNRAIDRMQRLFEEDNGSIRARQLASVATWDMLKAEWPMGSGAGSFRFVFPIYQQHYPELFKTGNRRRFWDYAHNDILQIPLELGVAGTAALLFCGAFWLMRLARAYVWEKPFGLIVAFGALTLLAHSWTDFLFYCPAILIPWCALWPIVVLWTDFEEQHAKS